jgi:uncharacterized protein (TIGR01777 family)
MRVIITGATGFIGRALTKHLFKRGYEVIAVTRSQTKAQDLLGKQVQSVKCDGTSLQAWASMVDGARAIINLAGQNLGSWRWTTAVKRTILQSRLDAGRAIVEAIEMSHVKPQVVVQASGVGFYGPHGEELLDESSSSGNDFLAEVARQWETSTRSVETLGVRHVVIRTGGVLEKDGGILPRVLLPFRLLVGPIGSNRVWLSWIHRDDEVPAIRFLIENQDLRGPFNLTAPEPLTLRAFYRLLAQVIGRPSWLPIPDFALRLLFGKMAQALLLSGQRVLPKRLQAAGFQFRYPTADTALSAILPLR